MYLNSIHVTVHIAVTLFNEKSYCVVKYWKDSFQKINHALSLV